MLLGAISVSLMYFYDLRCAKFLSCTSRIYVHCVSTPRKSVVYLLHRLEDKTNGCMAMAGINSDKKNTL